jgi:hypothetical protein
MYRVQYSIVFVSQQGFRPDSRRAVHRRAWWVKVENHVAGAGWLSRGRQVARRPVEPPSVDRLSDLPRPAIRSADGIAEVAFGRAAMAGLDS